MAQHQLRPVVRLGFVDKTKANSKSAPVSTSSVATPANYASAASIDTRLAAISGTTYTQKMLDIMSINDKIWALRQSDDAGTI